MSKFAYYLIYINKNDENPLENMEVVKDGFSFIAGLLTFIWFFMKRMWVVAAGLFVFLLGVSYLRLQGYITMETEQIVRGVLFVFLGTSAYDLYAMKLKRRGYSFEGVVVARDDMEAQLRFLEQYRKTQKEAEAKPATSSVTRSNPTGKAPELKW